MTNTASDSLSPKISIVMAAYNEEHNITGALDSIIAQTFIDWELIVIDDGSTDSTAAIVRRYAHNDSRICLVCNETNLELSLSLNRGVAMAQADLIARADADDINLPERLAKQYEHMEAHPEIDVLGTAAYLLDNAGDRVNIYAHPLTHAELAGLSFLKIQFFHPSVMIRRRFFDTVGLYDQNYTHAQDKEIWLRGLSVGCCYANLPEPLIEYSTGGYVKSWRSILKHARALLRMARELEIERGYTQTLVLFVYTAAIKLRIYRPKSLR
ncbi:MAG: glycosyltransferase involved in cell wall biosynthesis [Halioglobus sp.]|jgi:glycosyltransferase involved in cell wall biosynthesis